MLLSVSQFECYCTQVWWKRQVPILMFWQVQFTMSCSETCRSMQEHRVRACGCVHAHTHTHTHTHTRVHACIHACRHAHTHTHMCMHAHTTHNTPEDKSEKRCGINQMIRSLIRTFIVSLYFNFNTSGKVGKEEQTNNNYELYWQCSVNLKEF